jgi:hypothetical protein
VLAAAPTPSSGVTQWVIAQLESGQPENLGLRAVLRQDTIRRDLGVDFAPIGPTILLRQPDPCECGGGCFHISFRSGSRAGGACARGAFDYISRSGKYDEADRDEAIYIESDHMPSWAEEDPAT